MQPIPDIKLIKNSRQVLKSKEVTVTELEVSNRFKNLKEEECLAEQSEIKDENIHESMFNIGKLNIFRENEKIESFQVKLRLIRNRRKEIV